MAILHDIKSPQTAVEVHYVRFTPNVSAGDAGVQNISGSMTGIRIWHLSASDASPYPGVFGITLDEPHARLLYGEAKFTPSSSLEGTGSNGQPIPRHSVVAKLFTPASFAQDKTCYVYLIQTSGSGNAMTRDHSHDGKAGRPVDVSGTVHDHVDMTFAFQNIKGGF